MEVLIENIITYSFVALLTGGIIYFQLRRNKEGSKLTQSKIEKAKELGLYEPVTLHPVVNLDICIGSAACIKACPEHDILGLVDGKARTINASRCVGHGACFHACPVGAITLMIGTEKRGVDLPHVSREFETNVKGIYIAGELGGMGLIKNAVEQGRQAMENIVKHLKRSPNANYDVVIIGAGPAGISATLAAKEKNLKCVALEQNTLGGTVYSFPRRKIVMTSPMHLPLYGKVKFKETSKPELLALWNEVLQKNKIQIKENQKVVSIDQYEDHFSVKTLEDSFTANSVLVAIGRRGSPRKLGVRGEQQEKVAYRLIEPELISNQNVLIVGGGDSAIEAALSLFDDASNKVTLSYRGDSFSRIKPMNFEKINKAEKNNQVEIIFNSQVVEIKEKSVILSFMQDGIMFEKEIINDLVYVFAGGELPNEFLEKAGIRITKKFGEAILKH